MWIKLIAQVPLLGYSFTDQEIKKKKKKLTSQGRKTDFPIIIFVIKYRCRSQFN